MTVGAPINMTASGHGIPVSIAGRMASVPSAEPSAAIAGKTVFAPNAARNAIILFIGMANATSAVRNASIPRTKMENAVCVSVLALNISLTNMASVPSAICGRSMWFPEAGASVLQFMMIIGFLWKRWLTMYSG